MQKLTHSGNIIIAGFIGMILFMSVMVYLSIKQNFDMVSKNYYEEELQFQNKIDATQNAIPYDAAFKINQQNKNIALQIPESLAKDIKKAEVVFYCLSNSKLDKTIALQANATGLYAINAQAWEAAHYKVKISIATAQQDYYKELALSIP
jgi:nitrogen fixation protein FixH